jgi:hypothetical protein
MKIITCILYVSLTWGCFPKFQYTEEDRLYLKELAVDSVNLKWFCYSTVSSITPDFVTIEKYGITDTICIADNIAHLKLERDTITIGFYGAPKEYNRMIQVPDKIMDYKIKVDSTYVSNAPYVRNYYKKK